MKLNKNLLTAMLISGTLAVGQSAFAASDTTDQTTMNAGATAPPAAGSTTMAQMPMQKNMQKMLDQMTQIHETKDPAKRRELLKQHMQSMSSMMKMMHGMMGGQSMMGQGMKNKGMMGCEGMKSYGMMGGQGTMNHGMMGQGMGHGMKSKAMMNRLNMMERRMNMMQMMMDQMLKSQQELTEKE